MKNYRLTIAIILAIIVVTIGDSSMKVKKAFIKTRRTETHVTAKLTSMVAITMAMLLVFRLPYFVVKVQRVSHAIA